MYRQSDDLRFVKNRAALQRAFIDLTLEKRTTRITVKELADRAGVNRMTFYSHYDEVSDVLAEFIDGLTAEIMGAEKPIVVKGSVDSESADGIARAEDATLGIESILLCATDAMEDELEFYRLVALDGRFELYRERFREAFAAIFIEQLKESSQFEGIGLKVTADMLASGVTYAYLDWLAGKYGDLPIEELVILCEQFVIDKESLISLCCG